MAPSLGIKGYAGREMLNSNGRPLSKTWSRAAFLEYVPWRTPSPHVSGALCEYVTYLALSLCSGCANGPVRLRERAQWQNPPARRLPARSLFTERRKSSLNLAGHANINHGGFDV